MLLVSHPPGRLPERRYILDVLLRDFLGLDYVARTHDKDHVVISLQGDPRGKRLILADTLFLTPEDEWLRPSSLPELPLEVWDLSHTPIDATMVTPKLPVIYGTRLPNGSYCECSDSGISLGLDILGSAFFMLTRYEEIVKKARDQYDRFPASASLAWQEGFLDRPIVNEYLEILWSLLKRLWPGLERKTCTHRVLLSHDVDRPLYSIGRRLFSVLKSSAGDVIKRRDASFAFRRLRSYVKAQKGCFGLDPYNTFDLIMGISEKHGLRSAFYFMAGKNGGQFDATYNLEHPWIRRLMKTIHERGHEIGLHASYLSFRDPARTKQELEELLHIADEEGIRLGPIGGRQHFLRWENPTTWQSWEDAGLDYDSTLGFADQVGFRCGVCYEYGAFNLWTRQPLRLRERPLIVMECSLLAPQYMRLTPEQAWQETVRLRDRCSMFNGDFTVLWHNSELVERKETDLYKRLVTMLAAG